MADISFWGNSWVGTGGNGSSDYNKLINKPVQNISISGSPVILSSLTTGIYNISGTWAILNNSEVFDTPDDDLFYVTNNAEHGCKVTRVSASGVYVITCPFGGTASDIVYDTVATATEVAEEVMDNLWGTF